jgi:hypothetical protein
MTTQTNSRQNGRDSLIAPGLHLKLVVNLFHTVQFCDAMESRDCHNLLHAVGSRPEQTNEFLEVYFPIQVP